ncbi:hypothetical protein EDD18DRAFT_367841 [Armillaria luteobubalina]|uniref:Uncharacterized protein n=1 Tax=Armillaria luteobubalina TaxID=153913 RepID=A0AA39TLV4_9AGAR|nr:hypothetical protein EDD18DRAFT_367841 [Armillaria luteobubalina]
MTLQCNAVANQGNESTVIALWLLHVILASYFFSTLKSSPHALIEEERRLFLTKALNAIKVDNEIWDQSTACFSVSRNTRACLGGQASAVYHGFAYRLASYSFHSLKCSYLPRLSQKSPKDSSGLRV